MSTAANDREERRTMPYEPAGPTAAEHRADEHPPFTSRTRSCGDFLADLEHLAAAWDEGFSRGFYDVLAGGSRDASESDAVNPYLGGAA